MLHFKYFAQSYCHFYTYSIHFNYISNANADSTFINRLLVHFLAHLLVPNGNYKYVKQQELKLRTLPKMGNITHMNH